MSSENQLSASRLRLALERIRIRTGGPSYGMGTAIAAMCDDALAAQSPNVSDETPGGMTLSDAQIEGFMAEARGAINRGRALDSQMIAAWALWTMCQEAKRFRALRGIEVVASGGPLAKRTSVMSETRKSGYRLVIGFERRADLDAAHKFVCGIGHGPALGAQSPPSVSMEGQPMGDPHPCDLTRAGCDPVTGRPMKVSEEGEA